MAENGLFQLKLNPAGPQQCRSLLSAKRGCTLAPATPFFLPGDGLPEKCMHEVKDKYTCAKPTATVKKQQRLL
jgi:hypothetical protein